MGKKYILEHGLFDKEAMTFLHRKKLLQVKADKQEKTFREREDAGGGAYWANSYVTYKSVVTRYFAYDGDNCVGEILECAFFKDPNRKHLKIQISQLK